MPSDIRAAAQQAEAELTAEEQNPTEATSEASDKDVEVKDTAKQSEEEVETKPTSEIKTDTQQVKVDDPLALLDSLKLDDTQKKLLRDGYLRQADYTKKTQELAKNAKLIDEYNQFKPYIDKVLANPELSKLVFADKTDEEQEYPDDPKAFAERIRQETLAEMEKKNSEREFQKQLADDTKEASTLDSRLTTNVTFMKSIAGIVNSDPDYILNGGNKTAVQATKDALETYKNWEQQLKSDYRKELEQELAKKRLVVPTGGSPISTAGQRPTSIREAAQRAEEELNR